MRENPIPYAIGVKRPRRAARMICPKCNAASCSMTIVHSDKIYPPFNLPNDVLRCHVCNETSKRSEIKIAK